MDSANHIKTAKADRVILETLYNGGSGSSSSTAMSGSGSSGGVGGTGGSSVSSTGSSSSTPKPCVGTLCVTANHLIFVTLEGHKEIWISYMLIESVEKKSLTARGTPLRIKCKDFREFVFIFPKERDCINVNESLLYLAFPTTVERLDAFSFTPNFEITFNGWDAYNPHVEFARMGVPNDRWMLTDINTSFSLCPTYTRWLFVPVTVTDDILIGSAKFRSKGRLPVLSYYHSSNHASITRCSQPLVGIKLKRSTEDEQMIQAIFEANSTVKQHYIVDARPRKNAYAQKAGGKGYESMDCYLGCRYLFMDIENIHVMRDSLNKLVEACQPNNDNYLSTLESSGWLKHIKAIMDASIFIANAIVLEGSSCVVHCSDGWDRTAQLIALAEILIDPYYRTLDGFQVIVEKEWLWSGHKFLDRCGFIEKNSKEISPVFIQFLDTVWQLLRQFPTRFEFNERYLLTLHELLFSCQYGTFLGNCEQARFASQVASKTVSVWSYIAFYRSEFINPLYDGTGSNSPNAVAHSTQLAQQATKLAAAERAARVAANKAAAAATAAAVAAAAASAASSTTPPIAGSDALPARAFSPAPSALRSAGNSPANLPNPSSASSLSSFPAASLAAGSDALETASMPPSTASSSASSSSLDLLSSISSSISSQVASLFSSPSVMFSSPMVGDADEARASSGPVAPASLSLSLSLSSSSAAAADGENASDLTASTVASPTRPALLVAARKPSSPAAPPAPQSMSTSAPGPSSAAVAAAAAAFDRSMLLQPSTNPQRLGVWFSLYARTLEDLHPKESVDDRTGFLSDRNEHLRANVNKAAFDLWQAHFAQDQARESIIRQLTPFAVRESGLSAVATTANGNGDATAAGGLAPLQRSSGKASAAVVSLIVESVLERIITKAVALSEGVPVFDSQEVLSDALQKSGGEISAPPKWQNDRDVKRCTICASAFDFVSRKHHCRACGQVVCFQCASKTAPLPQHLVSSPVRVCKTCFKRLPKQPVQPVS